ncbi:plastocyanin/azurin family copper-binding protein [Paenibacillus alkaliterrae]|uniref:plastocyanin/azurin family copper-binding protein n=1 Tax=Paenibacillus alkaliterrae TaxID=320909 RepID=UPI001F2000D9|nr:plastocyanin/azurin family copper-binding protein [Paenibacillus alkaliterrae]MCF2939619.1 plastocyanin/azurin family copper-binding protein [Paenibacillus alkaliterrae]
MKKWLLFASAICLVIVLAACGANSGANQQVNTSVADSGAATSELVITASNWKFDKTEYKIKAGETFNLKLDSIDGMHGVQIKKTKYEIDNGKTVSVNFSEPGEYDMICSLPCGQGHRTMVAKLIVE